MKINNIKWLFPAVLVIASVGLLAKHSLADVPPIPLIGLNLTYNNQKITDPKIYASILICLSPDYDKINAGVTGGVDGIPAQLRTVRIPGHDERYSDSHQESCVWCPEYIEKGDGSCGSKDHCNIIYGSPGFPAKLAVFLPSLKKVFISLQISRTSLSVNVKAEGNQSERGER